MPSWFRDHATEIQAFAAIVQVVIAGTTVLLTAGLVWVTRKYVNLTSDLAETARADRERHRLAIAADRLRLESLVLTLWRRVSWLPQSLDEHALREADLWNDSEIDELLASIPSVVPEATHDAGKVATRLRWLAERVRFAKASDHRAGTDWRQLPSEGWPDQLYLAALELGRLDTYLSGGHPDDHSELSPIAEVTPR